VNNISTFDQLDQAIEAMIASPEAPLVKHDPQLAELLRVASDLLQLPRPDFKMHLKTELEWVASARPLSTAPQPKPVVDPDILPSLFRNAYGTYPVRRIHFAASLAVHAAAAVLVLALGVMAVKETAVKQATKPVSGGVVSLAEYIPPVGTVRPHGGGGGGGADMLDPSKGSLPRPANAQITPPIVVIRNLDPKLKIEPTIVAPNLHLPQTSQLGDPLSGLMTPSDGRGVGGGIGSNAGGGVGAGTGPGFGPGNGGNFGDGVFTVGNGVSAPRVIYDPEPEYSQEARAAKHQGTVTLWAIIAPDGRPRELRVERSLGMGLDEKAIEAVRTWRFEPAKKDGRPVPVMIEVEVSFHLY